MQVESLAIPEVKLIRLRRFGDDRGWFCETFSAARFVAAGLPSVFPQDNASFSRHAGTIRGLHYQLEPDAQGKFVRVLRGAILDVVVDIRPGSPSFGQHVAAKLTSDGMEALWVPVGFAHGFCTLVPDTEVEYKVTALYSPTRERGILWNDPALGIEWPVSDQMAVLSDKDRVNPTLAAAELPQAFQS